MSLKTTGYTSKTPLSYLIDAGAVYKNLKLDETTGAYVSGDLIGATEGGNQFQLEQSMRTIEVDGLKGAGKGNEVIEEENATLTVNLKELTAKNVAMAIVGSTTDTTNPYYDVIKSKGKIEIADYIDNVAFVGRLSGNNKPVIIIVKNVINMEGLNIETEDDGEVTVTMAFKGHYDQDNVELGEGPYEIYWPKMEGSIMGTISDGTGTVEGATVEVSIGTDTITTTTDADGAYLLTGIPEGNYSVTATKDTATGTATVDVVGGETTETINITIS